MSFVCKVVFGWFMFLCEIEGVECVLFVFVGLLEYLNWKGIECGWKWIEEQIGFMEVCGGDYFIFGVEKVVGVIFLLGVMNVLCIKELQQVVIEVQDNIEEIC